MNLLVGEGIKTNTVIFLLWIKKYKLQRFHIFSAMQAVESDASTFYYTYLSKLHITGN